MSVVYLYSRKAQVIKRWQDALYDVEHVSLSHVDVDSPSAVVLIHWQSLTESEKEPILSGKSQSTVIVLSDLPDTEEAARLILSGVKGYANTYIHDSLLPDVIRQVESGNVWAVPEVMQRLLRGFLHHPRPQRLPLSMNDLTNREREVYNALKEGKTNKHIANHLGVSERTIKAHVSAILSKTGLSDRVELILAQEGMTDENI